jgi:hypothetical protein
VLLRWTISNGACPASTADVTITINLPPTTATVGANQTICALGTTAGLGGNAPTSGMGQWSVVSGGTGTFSNAATPNATFTHTSGAGPIVLRWTISNPPCAVSTADVTITINQLPTTATVGPNQTICALGTTVGLGGNTPTTGTGAWSVVSGGTGTFSNTNTPNATFTHTSGAGPVVLRWTISNPPCPASTNDVTITITQPPTTANAGPDQSVCGAGLTTTLAGNAPSVGSGTWTKVIGPGTVVFSNANSPTSTATASLAGVYTLRWTIANGICPSSTDDVVITYAAPPNCGAPPVLTANLTDPLVCTGPGNVLTGTIQLTNPTGAQQVFSLSTTFTNYVGLSCTVMSAVAGATCTINVGGGGLMAAGSIPANGTITAQYQAQVGNVPTGTVLTATSSATVGGVAATPNPLVFTTTVNCPAVGPGLLLSDTAEVSDQKAGSVLVYNLYSSSIAAPNQQNTRISITNTHPVLSIAVHLFFVDGATCSIADSLVCLTPNQTASFLASDIDPGTTGYIIAVASNLRTGCPVDFNYLIGDEYVKLSSGHAANLAAEGFAAIAGGLPACNGLSVTALLSFDGASYNRAPRVLAASNIPHAPMATTR